VSSGPVSLLAFWYAFTSPSRVISPRQSLLCRSSSVRPDSQSIERASSNQNGLRSRFTNLKPAEARMRMTTAAIAAIWKTVRCFFRCAEFASCSCILTVYICSSFVRKSSYLLFFCSLLDRRMRNLARLYMQCGETEYSIAALYARFDDPALVNVTLLAIVMSGAHLNVAERRIFKCPLG